MMHTSLLKREQSACRLSGSFLCCYRQKVTVIRRHVDYNNNNIFYSSIRFYKYNRACIMYGKKRNICGHAGPVVRH